MTACEAEVGCLDCVAAGTGICTGTIPAVAAFDDLTLCQAQSCSGSCP